MRKGKTVALYVVIALALAAALLAGCAPKTDEEKDVIVTLAAPDGAALYATHCSKCHGAGGQGGIGPRIKPPAFERQDLFMVIAEGVAGTQMAPFAGVIDEMEVDAIMDYLLAK
jgi:mono/diheme cytochrome c family protein